MGESRVGAVRGEDSNAIWEWDPDVQCEGNRKNCLQRCVHCIFLPPNERANPLRLALVWATPILYGGIEPCWYQQSVGQETHCKDAYPVLPQPDHAVYNVQAWIYAPM